MIDRQPDVSTFAPPTPAFAPWDPGRELQVRVLDRVRAAALDVRIASAGEAFADEGSRFVEALNAAAENPAKIMGRVHDALLEESDEPDGGFRAAARVLVAWREAGGVRTNEPGASMLGSLCESARGYLDAASHLEQLRCIRASWASDAPHEDG